MLKPIGRAAKRCLRFPAVTRRSRALLKTESIKAPVGATRPVVEQSMIDGRAPSRQTPQQPVTSFHFRSRFVHNFESQEGPI